MLNVKNNQGNQKIKINLIIIIAMMLTFILLMSNYSLAVNAFNMNLKSSTDIIGVQNDVSRFIQPNTPIYYEDLVAQKGLICNGHGIPLVSRKSSKNPLKDATLNASGINVEIDQLTESNKIQRNPAYDYTKNQPNARNPYGNGVVTTSRTQALYNNKGLKDLSYREAYVLAHEKDTSSYPDNTQLSHWGVTKYQPGASLGNEDTYISSDNREISKNRVNEAINYEDAMNRLEAFKNSNNDRTLVDKTNYDEVHPGYNKVTGKIIVGPFVWDYVRAYYKPTELGQSQTVNEDGVVSYIGITGIKWYADDEKTLEIKNVTLVYGERSLGNGDEKYKYPYPNEPFYIEFSKSENPEVKSISKAEVDLDIMNASGQAYELEGSFNDVNWIAKDNPIKCTCTDKVCIHGIRNHRIQHTSGSFWGSSSYYTTCPQLYCAQHMNQRAGNGHLQGHDFYIEGEAVNIGTVAQPLYVVPISTIKIDNNVADMELGSPQFFMPPLPFPGGYYREDIYEYVEYLPEEPCNPNDPDPKPEPEPDPTPEVNPVIPLIFEIAGEVWIDNPTGKESLSNGIKDEGEKGKQNVEVYLYNKENDSNPVAKTVTNYEGKYTFGFIEIGEEYYVEFVYDGMTYKTTKYLNSLITESLESNLSDINNPYIDSPENYLNASHAVENILERDVFNSKFNVISNNVATSILGLQTPLKYYNVVSSQGTMASLITTDSAYMTLPEFKMSARTSNTGLYLPLNDSYYVNTDNLDLPNQNGQEYNYIRTYEGLRHINLGLVKREQGDFAIKNDTYQTILTMKEDIQKYEYNNKTTSALTYDANKRTSVYYTDKQYTQLINSDDYNWRFDTSYGEDANISSSIFNVSDELNIYIEYKFLIRNQASLEWGQIKELSNYFDKELRYSRTYDFTNMTSWIEKDMNGSEDSQKQEVVWEYGSDKDGYSTIYTDDLADISMNSGDTLELHLILQVSKDAARNIILNSNSNPNYDNILEITKFSVNEGLVDRDSNPGSSKLNDTKTYEDDTDNSPFVRLKLDDSEYAKTGNIISGNVYEDLKSSDSVLVNNLFTGNGIKDNNEKGIADVKVELIEVLTDKVTGREVELLVVDEIRTDPNGNYRFTNLSTGTYKVKFTYGDEYQLQKDITYNGQDYKSVSTDTLKQQYQNSPMEVMILIDTSEGMSYNSRLNTIKNASKQLVSSIYNKVQKAKVGIALFSEPESNNVYNSGLIGKPNADTLVSVLDKEYSNYGANLADTIRNSLNNYSNTSTAKVMVILTDGYTEDMNDDREMIEAAKAQGVQVISIVCTMDNWSKETFGTEGNSTSQKLYNISDTSLTEYITEVALEDTLFELEKTLPNLTDAKDVQTEYVISDNSKVGDIHTRQKNIEYTDVMVNENGEIVNGKNTSNLGEFAKNTQITAVTPKRTVMISHDNSRTENTNLSLIERPKVELQIKEEIASFKVTLANGTVIVDSEKDLKQNVLELKDKKIIHLDDEIIQGAELFIKYKITVVNNGQVDTLGEYYDYDMFNSSEVAKYTASVPTRIGTVYNYFDNLTFRAEENNRMQIEENRVILDNMKFTNGQITNANELINNGKVYNPDIVKIESKVNENGQTILLDTATVWQQKAHIGTAADVDDKLKKSILQVVSTESLKDLELYPTISKEVLSGNHLTSVSTYIQFSKTLSANDSTDTLSYNNAVEIVERLNELGRRDYNYDGNGAVPGNYVSFEDITEYDSAKAENLAILNPFGDGQKIYYSLIVGCVIILGAGIIFIKRKVM